MGSTASPAQGLKADAVLRGVGIPETKSLELTSVSVQPPSARRSAVVLLGAGAGPAPSKQLAVLPKPTKSTTLAPKGQPDPLRGVVLLTKATSPAVAPIVIEPVTSGVGNAVVPPVPCAC